MEIPNKVRIGSVDYEVTVEDKTIVLDAVQCKGKIDYEYHKINIDSSIHDKQGQEQTFLHELIHGIVRERNLNLNADEETIVDGLAIGLHQVIRDNQHIFIKKCAGGSKSLGELCAEEKGIKISKYPMCGHKLYEKQTSVPYFTKYNLCRNKETGKEFFYKSQRMDPIEMQLISVEDIFTNFIISRRDFKNNYEILEESNKCKKISPINLK